MATAPEKLKREAAGRYVSADGRFTVEQSSGRWVAIDAETTDDLGLPLVRGPFDTLDDAKVAVAEARTAPKATSNLAARLKAVPKRGGGRTAPAPARTSKAAEKPREPEIELRDFAAADGEALRALWKAAGFRSVGDDDRSLAAFAERSPGLLVVATADGEVIGSALGGWDGRRGWIYHVAVAERYRRKGIATRLVHRVEQRLRVAGAPKISAIVRDENDTAKRFWAELGYEVAPTHQYAREV
ncbi:MAG TPA: GNAT family N-acetyltransferase [Candidatus Limnocylindrales bacterium]